MYKPSTVAVLGRNLLVLAPVLVYWFSVGAVVDLEVLEDLLEAGVVAEHTTMLG
jgi:hypothetical protein